MSTFIKIGELLKMNKRVKIVSTLGPAVETRGGKNSEKKDTGEKSLMLKHQHKPLLI